MSYVKIICMLYARNYKHGLMGWTFAQVSSHENRKVGQLQGEPQISRLEPWSSVTGPGSGFWLCRAAASCCPSSGHPSKKGHTSSSRLCELFIFPFHLLMCRFVLVLFNFGNLVWTWIRYQGIQVPAQSPGLAQLAQDVPSMAPELEP